MPTNRVPGSSTQPFAYTEVNREPETGPEAENTTNAELVYIVQNLNDQTILSLEWVDGADAKVLRRSTLDTDIIDQPSALSLGAENGLVALGVSDGWIYVLDQEKGKIKNFLASWI